MSAYDDIVAGVASLLTTLLDRLAAFPAPIWTAGDDELDRALSVLEFDPAPLESIEHAFYLLGEAAIDGMVLRGASREAATHELREYIAARLPKG